ncbi:Mbov_0392 family ICE element protein [Metamycoplasma hominis]|uniref:Mbov_0392 family ICE element protein n=1 Tax=Metamycoplasma hominis TaxID=2098 RepID=UPI0012AB2662|nr:hypothetical protein [Metamycoplasma hominis]
MEIKPFKINDILYMTQYDDIWYNDHKVLNYFNNTLFSLNSDEEQKLYKEQICQIAKQMEESDDFVNQWIYDKLITSETRPNYLEGCSNIINTLSSDNWISESDWLKYSASQFMEENDIIRKDELIEIIDEDLKANGYDSQWINGTTKFNVLEESPNEKYVYVNPYLEIEPINIKEIKDDYIEALKTFDLDDLLESRDEKSLINLDPNESPKSSLSDFDKTPTDLKDSKVINEYNKSSHTPSESQSKSHSLTK